MLNYTEDDKRIEITRKEYDTLIDRYPSWMCTAGVRLWKQFNVYTVIFHQCAVRIRNLPHTGHWRDTTPKQYATWWRCMECASYEHGPYKDYGTWSTG